MRICKNCGTEAIDDDLMYCSRCGSDLSKKENLLKKSVSDVILEGTDLEKINYVVFKTKKRKIAALLQFLVGFSGAAFFYLGLWQRGLVMIGLNLGFCLISGLLLNPLWMFGVFFMNFALGLGFLFKKDLIDGRGNDLQ